MCVEGREMGRGRESGRGVGFVFVPRFCYVESAISMTEEVNPEIGYIVGIMYIILNASRGAWRYCTEKLKWAFVLPLSKRLRCKFRRMP